MPTNAMARWLRPILIAFVTLFHTLAIRGQASCGTCANPCPSCLIQFIHPLVCPGVNDSILNNGCVDDFPDVARDEYATRCYEFVPLYDSLAFSLWIDYSGGGCSSFGDCDQFCSCVYSLSYQLYYANSCTPLNYTYHNGYCQGWEVGDSLVICFTWMARCRHHWAVPLAWTEVQIELLPIANPEYVEIQQPAPIEERRFVDYGVLGQVVGPNYQGITIRCYEDGTHDKFLRTTP